MSGVMIVLLIIIFAAVLFAAGIVVAKKYMNAPRLRARVQDRRACQGRDR